MYISKMEDWEFGVLQIHNPEYSTYKPYFELLNQLETLPGDILEFGVWRGASLITSALILQELKSTKKIHGYDTFSGFPSNGLQDDFENFEKMYSSGQITRDHYDRVNLNKKHLRASGKGTSVTEISGSLNFSATSYDLVSRKIEYFELSKYIELHVQDVKFMTKLDIPPAISLALLDLDLYQGYEKVLPLIWDNLRPGGAIYLDEYFSLKFPGPRIAVDAFAAQIGTKPEKLCTWMDFERWVIRKPLL
jgi:hypothetical protein